MNIQLKIVILLVMLLGATSVAYAESKIGYVNFGKLMEKSQQGQAVRKALESEFSSRDKQLAVSRDAILKMEEQLKNDGSIMSEANRVKLERDILSKKRDHNRLRDEYREDINIRRNEEISALQKKVYEVIKKFSEQQKYDLVLTQAVLYASPQVDITDQILQRLNSGQ
ncbi:MAG: OmpH family outer membrane protein [Gammaproteobacteria bacterium]|nr:OmpH family outer membrane protein [Gammaproteobacteria bacterium]